MLNITLQILLIEKTFIYFIIINFKLELSNFKLELSNFNLELSNFKLALKKNLIVFQFIFSK